MFLVLFCTPGCGALPRCYSPLHTPPPVPNGVLLHAQVLVRHGARAASDNYSSIEDTGDWFCNEADAIAPRFYPAPILHPRVYREKFDSRLIRYKPSCRDEDLITLGMQQHRELGQLYHDYFVENTHLLPPDFSPDLIYPRSTMVDCAMKSLISFFQGMYPPKSSNEVICMMTDTDSSSFLHPSKDYCDELSDQVDYFTNTTQFIEYFAGFSAKYRDLLEPIIGSWDPSDVKSFVSWIVDVNCTDHKLPDYADDALIADCIAFLAVWIYGINDDDRYRAVGSSPLFREIFRMADEFLAMKLTAKFVFLSSHDTQIGAILPTFGQSEDVPPLFRSHFLFELWDVENVVTARLAYNGRVLPIDFLNNQTLVRYSNLKTEMARRGFLSHCPIPP